MQSYSCGTRQHSLNTALMRLSRGTQQWVFMSRHVPACHCCRCWWCCCTHPVACQPRCAAAVGSVGASWPTPAAGGPSPGYPQGYKIDPTRREALSGFHNCFGGWERGAATLSTAAIERTWAHTTHHTRGCRCATHCSRCEPLGEHKHHTASKGLCVELCLPRLSAKQVEFE